MDPLLKDLKPKRYDGAGYYWELCRVRGKKGKVAVRVAALLAARIVSARLPAEKAALWREAHQGTTTLSSEQRERLLAYLEPDFGRPGTIRDDERLMSAVSEALWYELVIRRSESERQVVKAEAHTYSINDPGGDGLVVYRTSDGELTFRLWEIKKHTGAGEVRATATGAHRQLKARALSYLARFSSVHQQLADAELREFYARLVDHWQAQGDEVGAGVAVSATISGQIPDMFDGLVERFPLLKDRLEAQANAFGDFEVFCELVRDELWKGL